MSTSGVNLRFLKSAAGEYSGKLLDSDSYTFSCITKYLYPQLIYVSAQALQKRRTSVDWRDRNLQ